jgi:hypothetical protein
MLTVVYILLGNLINNFTDKHKARPWQIVLTLVN